MWVETKPTTSHVIMIAGLLLVGVVMDAWIGE
jgi:hypothetical protein